MTAPPKTRSVTLACGDRALPDGRLVGLKPALDAGGSLRLLLARPDGSAEPLIWLKDFDPAFADTYWLRTPLTVSRGMRLVSDTSSCTLVLTYLG